MQHDTLGGDWVPRYYEFLEHYRRHFTVTRDNLAWDLTRKMLHPSIKKFIRRSFRTTVPGWPIYEKTLAHKIGLELGGPSEIFTDEGIFPVYKKLAGLDNCLYSTNTIWTGNVRQAEGFTFHPNKKRGSQFICEASDLSAIADASYDCVLASHCLEHVANPLRALAEWKRVTKPDGFVLLILPHKDGTFDWQRPTTALSHMVADYENNVSEDDLTHLQEILTLHDLGRDKAAGTMEQFRERCLDNLSRRAMHHHVFDTRSALRLVDRAGFALVQVDVVKPFHIIILAQNRGGAIDNAAFLGERSECRLKSPFPSDHIRVENPA
jgi:SAM-dependent methyltransferase